MIATKQVPSQLPLVVRRRVKWGECDPSRALSFDFQRYRDACATVPRSPTP